MMTASNTPYAVAKFDLYDPMGGTLSSLRVTLEDVPEGTGFDADNDLSSLSGGATSSGMSLWKDNGDGVFDPSNDTIAETLSASWNFDVDLWQATFSSINWNFSLDMKVFLVFSADQISDVDTKGFDVFIEEGDMVVDDGMIGAWPSWDNYLGRPVWIGEAGMDGFGSPLLISEIQTASGGSTADEFIEIYNRAPMSMDLSEWSIKISSSTDTDSLNWLMLYDFSSSPDYVMEEGEFFLLGNGNLSTTTDVTTPLNRLDESGGYVGLFDDMGEIMDWVGYGSLSNLNLAEGGQATWDGATLNIPQYATAPAGSNTQIQYYSNVFPIFKRFS